MGVFTREMAGLFLAVAVLFSIACGHVAETPGKFVDPPPSPAIDLTPTPQSDSNSPIRKIDFKNFRFTGPDDYAETFILREGEKSFVPRKEDGIHLEQIEYADLTSDGSDEAIIVMSIQTGGSSAPGLVFIYALENERPKCLWKSMTGDRADGGFKSLDIEKGNLVIQLYGDTRLVNGSWKTKIPDGRMGDCCPTVFTSSVFTWDGHRFVQDGESVIKEISRDK
ncbi:MAG: hypothetical protein ABI999_17150 [Acidobacteriota bacterium]